MGHWTENVWSWNFTLEKGTTHIGGKSSGALTTCTKSQSATNGKGG
ncbi:hypothetical protein SLEP1_g40240 [Rubroshorea leprosula]|uniref:Uncharacterized protein n=1 Tax=Rubroshorea leprosula TaxID=152421 RepID=A0AAV5L2T1_9ROSI|nr:hypothetical protein SLEP1_g40240 [Rubroshorea leprosula]